jgi:hypothetical protein
MRGLMQAVASVNWRAASVNYHPVNLKWLEWVIYGLLGIFKTKDICKVIYILTKAYSTIPHAPTSIILQYSMVLYF